MTNESLRALCLAAINYNNAFYPDNGKAEKAAYIAAMDPTTTLALLDEIERKRDIIQKVLNNSSRADWPDDIYKELMEAKK